MRGFCLSCSRLSVCNETDERKVATDYTCSRFNPVPEAVFRAREATIQKYGEKLSIKAMLDRPEISKGDVDE